MYIYIYTPNFDCIDNIQIGIVYRYSKFYDIISYHIIAYVISNKKSSFVNCLLILVFLD